MLVLRLKEIRPYRVRHNMVITSAFGAISRPIEVQVQPSPIPISCKHARRSHLVFDEESGHGTEYQTATLCPCLFLSRSCTTSSV